LSRGVGVPVPVGTGVPTGVGLSVPVGVATGVPPAGGTVGAGLPTPPPGPHQKYQNPKFWTQWIKKG
jgi:hypothetical protein